MVGRRFLAVVRVALEQPVGEWVGGLAARRDVRADVDEDRVQPRAEAPVAGAPEAVQREQGSEKGLLDRVLRVLGVAQPAARGAEQGRVVGADDLGEGVRVAGAVRRHQANCRRFLDARDIVWR